MAKHSKTDLLPKVKKLFCDDYPIIYATEDGLFFSDTELAKEHAKKIGSVVFTYKEEDLKNTDQPAAPEATTLIPAAEEVIPATQAAEEVNPATQAAGESSLEQQEVKKSSKNAKKS